MATSDAPQRPKRKLKNAETVRERALKAQEAASAPVRPGIIARGAGTAAKPVKGLSGIFHYQPFRFLGKVLRLVGRVIFPRYLRNSWRELRLVTWPGRKQTRQLTIAVLLFAIVFGAIVSLVDFGLDKLFKEVLLK